MKIIVFVMFPKEMILDSIMLMFSCVERSCQVLFSPLSKFYFALAVSRWVSLSLRSQVHLLPAANVPACPSAAGQTVLSLTKKKTGHVHPVTVICPRIFYFFNFPYFYSVMFVLNIAKMSKPEVDAYRRASSKANP